MNDGQTGRSVWFPGLGGIALKYQLCCSNSNEYNTFLQYLLLFRATNLLEYDVSEDDWTVALMFGIIDNRNIVRDCAKRSKQPKNIYMDPYISESTFTSTCHKPSARVRRSYPSAISIYIQTNVQYIDGSRIPEETIAYDVSLQSIVAVITYDYDV